jgi:hypothetical protein
MLKVHTNSQTQQNKRVYKDEGDNLTPGYLRTYDKIRRDNFNFDNRKKYTSKENRGSNDKERRSVQK